MNNFSFKNIQNVLIKHSPELLMGFGISGLCFSIIYSVKATLKAKQNIDNYKEETKQDKLSFKEVIKCSWKPFIPVVISTAAAVPCLICSNGIYAKRNAMAAAAYALSETALNEYRGTVKDILGEQKEKAITEKVSSKEVNDTYENNKSQIILTGDGDSLFFEPLTSRYFKSNWNKILKAANRLNADALTNTFGSITLNDWFDEIGLDRTDLGSYMGWDLEHGMSDLIDISLNSSLTPDDIPCGAIYYNNRPRMF